MLDLEEKLIGMCKTDRFDLATAGFIASGIREKEELDSYLNRFEGLVSSIFSDIRESFSRFEYSTSFSYSDAQVRNAKINAFKAEAVFNWLWNSKPKRSKKPKSGNRAVILTDVLDNQLSDKEEVGDCMGLTSLYNSICQRLGIDVKAVWTTGHIYSVIENDRSLIPIENTLEEGFNEGCRKGVIIDNSQLIQRFLIRQASDYKKAENYREAYLLEEIALRINPKTADASSLFYLAEHLEDLNMAITSYQKILGEHPNSYEIMGQLAQSLNERNTGEDSLKAIALYDKVIKLKKETGCSSAYDYFCLGIIYLKNKKFDDATIEFQMATELEPEDAHYHKLLGDSLKGQEKYTEAITHYRRSLELEPDHGLVEYCLNDSIKLASQRRINLNPVYHLRKVINYLRFKSTS